MKTLLGASLAALLLAAASANAAVYNFSIDQSVGTPNGAHYQASASIDVQATQIVVTLTNSTANPTSPAQLLVAFGFTGSDTAGLYIKSESASFIDVASDGTYSSTPTPADFLANSTNTGKWRISNEFGKGVTLNWHSNPDLSIIGPPGGATYSNANAGIAGNGPHNPYIDQTATFTLNKPDGFPTDITSATFYFNTNMDTSYGGPPNSGVPEPATLGVLGIGAAGLLLRRRRTA